MAEIKPGHIPEINKENKESEPKITVDFFFSGHGTAEDVNRLPEALKNADIYIPEAIGWTKESEQIVNQISQGKAISNASIGSADEIEESSLYNSKIPVIFVDIPKGHRLIKDYQDIKTKSGEAFEDFLLGNFDEAVQIEKAASIDEALIIKNRENFITDKLKRELKTLTKKFPQLKNKPDIHVLMALGATHSQLYKKLKPELPSSKIILGRETYVFSTGDEIMRRLIKNPQETIDDNIYAKAMLEKFISEFFIYNISNNDINKANWASRKLVANLSMDQIRLFSKSAGDLFGMAGMLQSEEVRTRKLIKKLKEIGVNLPTTEAGVSELINLKKKTV